MDTDKKPAKKMMVSSRGVGYIDDEEQERLWIAARTPFTCSLCGYPVMAGWKFCPSCGGLLEWKSLAEAKSRDTDGHGFHG